MSSYDKLLVKRIHGRPRNHRPPAYPVHPAVQGERGQAMVETAVFSLTAVLLALGLLAMIPIHRARTVATAAAFACTQFVSQAADPARAEMQGEEVGRRTMAATWSGTPRAEYRIKAWTSDSGGTRGCRVVFRAPLLFGEALRLSPPEWRTVEFTAMAEKWKAGWD